jgi:hypothetical protein
MESTSAPAFSLEALLPADIAKRAEAIGARKCQLPFWPPLTLAILAGAVGGPFPFPLLPYAVL